MVDGIDEATFQKTAEKAKEGCPVSQLLKPGLEEMTLEGHVAKIEAVLLVLQGITS